MYKIVEVTYKFLIFPLLSYIVGYYYPLAVQPLYIRADHPSYLSKKEHKIFVFTYFRPKKWILQVHFAPYSVSHFPPHHFLPHSHHRKC